MLSLVVFIFIGLIVATIAKALVPGRDIGLGLTILLGTVAQVVAWFASHSIGFGRFGQPFQPGGNQGPMLGIFSPDPAGVLLGAMTGGALRLARPDWPTQWCLWALNAATAAYGLLVLDLVADSSWGH